MQAIGTGDKDFYDNKTPLWYGYILVVGRLLGCCPVVPYLPSIQDTTLLHSLMLVFTIRQS